METIDILKNKFMFENKNVLVIFDEENNPWFKAKDIAEILEYKNSKETIKYHVKQKYVNIYENIRGINSLPQNKIQNHTKFLNEPGLYQLIMKSKMKLADKFQDWVVEEVLPTIRQLGEYKVKNQLAIEFEEKFKIQEDQIKNLQKTTQIINKVLDKRNYEIRLLKPNAILPTRNNNLLTSFGIVKLNDPNKYTYYVIRCQRRTFNKTLNKLRNNFKNSELILYLGYNPNSINLYNKIKEVFKNQISYYGNYFNIVGNYPEKLFLENIEILCNS